MIFGIEDGSIRASVLDEVTDVEGDGATTMLVSTVKEVALFVPVGEMVWAGVLVGTTTADVAV